MRAPSVLAVGLLLLATPALAADDCGVAALAWEARTDQQPTGNRVVQGCAALTGSMTDLALSQPVTWVLPDPVAPGASWIVATADGTTSRVSADGDERLGELPPGAPPVALAAADGTVAVRADGEARARFDDPLPDTRVVRLHGSTLVALVGPTERYAHGVLGDAVEASAVEIVGDAADRVRIAVEPDAVIEGVSPLLADLTADGRPEILVTVSDPEHGARLRAYDVGGSLVAESDAIGRGFRWLHQVGVATTGPAGETEVIAVRTPHIGGVVEAYRLERDRLVRVAARDGYGSHRLGSPNLDMALLADADGDGRFDVVVPTQAMDALALLTRSADGFVEVARLPLGGTLVSNVAAAVDADGRLALAAATDEGRLRVFR